MHCRIRAPLVSIRWILFAAAVATPLAVHADNFVAAQYDVQSDALVVTMRYRGTNPDHKFTLQWGECKPGEPGGRKQISAVVLDDQWKDAARSPFKKTVRFRLTDVACRPATVTLHTAPRFYYTIDIPASR